ncbi:Mu P family protein [Ancylobacter pratisalsi]|uniref:Mu P family protein n=2 Tax=Ancylobacter pratisalsi TaxID=1745854 RepID=A0A6P1YNW0_9HYPH|nr:Mu P family protein [Ancylobacter pratisalsi]QIB34742.1 Mu P family protein [Ancylobacter pratisalsi]
MQDMTGVFRFELRDALSSANTLIFATLAGYKDRVRLGVTAEIKLDGETIMKGWVDTVAPHLRDGEASVSISGSDKARDLIDGAATVDGPSEYRGKTVDAIIGEIVKPYGLSVRAEVDVGAQLDRFTIDGGETAMSAIEKALRQRGILATSDGVDTIVLTRTGAKRAPAPLVLPGNVVSSSGEFTIEGRHSEYRVKGQAEKAAGKRRSTLRLDATAAPLDSDPADWIADQEATEGAGVEIEGKAVDPEMKRYRPLVTLGRTQLTAEGAQTQAEWMARTARGSSERLEYEVKDYRAGDEQRLWRVNELVPVDDRFQGVNRDMLIAGVVMVYSQDDGGLTRLRVTSPEAYDTEPEGARRSNHARQGKAAAKPLDSTAYAL